jgi:hypothetical protein
LDSALVTFRAGREHGLELPTLLTALSVPPGDSEAVSADPADVAECAAAWNERWSWRFPVAVAL